MFDLTQKSHIKAGLAIGLANFFVYVVFAAMFYSAGVIIKNNYDAETGQYDINPQDVFTAIFAMFFASTNAGMAASMGPDMGRAKAAADRIFKIIDSASKINAQQIDKDTSKKSILSPEQIEGKIEFRDVWFRYPTRKEDFVLRGLSLTINPQERVALVGESGCGKSTFVNLLMRFYDVDAGEILLDGVNIKDYNLHDLRRAISLVMQEPIIFNYSILENILYGDLEAKNSQVEEAAKIANCTEFLSQDAHLFEGDDSAESLMKEMTAHRESIIALIGQSKFEEEMDLLKVADSQEKTKGKFQAIEGNIDKREGPLKDV